MFCPNCGSPLEEGDAFCTNCGTSVENSQPAPGAAETKQPDPGPAAATAQDMNFGAAPQYAPQPGPQQSAPQFAPQPNPQQFAPQYAPQANQQQFPPQYVPQPNGQQYPPQGYQYAPNFAQPAPKKKGKGKIIALVSVLVVIAALAVLVALNFNTIKGWFGKSFSSPEEMMQSVEKSFVNEVVKPAIGRFDKTAEKIDDGELDVKISLELGELGKNMLASSGEMDFSWLEGLSLSGGLETDETQASGRLRLALNQTEIACLDIIADLENGELIFGLPGLNDKYVRLDLNELADQIKQGSSYNYDFGVDDILTSFSDGEFDVSELQGIMDNVDTDALGNVIEKVSDVFFGGFGEVVKSDGELTVNGVTQKCTVLDYDLTVLEIENIGKNVFTMLRDDKDAKKFLESAFVSVEKMTDEFDGFDSFYADYQNSIDGLLGEIDEAIKYYGEDADGAGNEVIAKLVDYVDSDYNLVGRSVFVNGNEMLKFAIAHDGSDFGFEITYEGMKLISGTGNDKGGKVNGTFNVYNEDQEIIVFVTTTDFVWDGLDSNKIKGEITITPSKDLFDSDDMTGLGAFFGSGSFAIKLSFDTDDREGNASLGLNIGDQSLVKFNVAYDDKVEDKVSAPDRSLIKDIDIEDEEDLTEWLSSINIEALLQRLQSAGVPSELLSGIEIDLD